MAIPFQQRVNERAASLGMVDEVARLRAGGNSDQVIDNYLIDCAISESKGRPRPAFKAPAVSAVSPVTASPASTSTPTPPTASSNPTRTIAEWEGKLGLQTDVVSLRQSGKSEESIALFVLACGLADAEGKRRPSFGEATAVQHVDMDQLAHEGRLRSEWTKNRALHGEFGTFEAFKTYRTAVADGRVSAIAKSPVAADVRAAAAANANADAPLDLEALASAARHEWQNSPALRREFSDVAGYVAYKKAEAGGYARRFGGPHANNHRRITE